MAVLPADHHIGDCDTYRSLIQLAASRAEAGDVVTLGIEPTRPETGYGYIEYRSAASDSIHRMEDWCIRWSVLLKNQIRRRQMAILNLGVISGIAVCSSLRPARFLAPLRHICQRCIQGSSPLQTHRNA